MFMALNSCPSFYVKLYWNAIYGNESRMAKFAANIIRKAKDDFKEKAQRIFSKMSSVLGFQHISYHYNEKETSTGKNISDVEGVYLNLNMSKILVES